MYNIYEQLNKMIDYIEEHILENIDIKVLSKITGLNLNALQSIFVCLTGVTIKEYIRLRRLSLSANDILNGESVTSVSYKYLYTSPSSFNHAFKNYHGMTPRNLKNSDKQLKLFNKIVFKEDIKNYNVNYKIYKNKEINLFGVSKKIDYKSRAIEIPSLWKEMKEKYPQFLNSKRYGFLYRNEKKETLYYFLLEEEFIDSKNISIPKRNYFAVKTLNFNSKNIINKINTSLNEYIESLNYKTLDSPNIEVYYDDYIEILIPIT